MSTGDITNGPYATRSKEYIWSRLAAVFPRGITPSDLDGVIEMSRCFFVFEGKTEGTKVSTGQALFLKRTIEEWPLGHSVLVLGEHPPLDRVDLARDLIRVQYGYRASKGFVWAPHVLTGAGALWQVACEFTKDAEQLGHLEPETWRARLEHDGRPFTEDVA